MPNNQMDSYYIVKSADEKINVKGVPYLDLTLNGENGELNGKLWDYKKEIFGEYAGGDVVKIRGTLTQFNNVDQLRVEKIRHITDEDDIDMSKLVPTADIEPEKMFDAIMDVVLDMKDEELKLLTKTILESNKKQLLYWPAAFKLHHAMRGGLLYHTLSILRMAQAVCKIYPSIDGDLLFCGTILHDISKLDEFEVGDSGVVTKYSKKGELLGHLVMGAMYVMDEAKKLGISDDTATLVCHMLISHHGTPEFGAPIRPSFLEAEILSELDTLDATIFEFEAAQKSTKTGEFSGRQWALDNRKLLNNGRKEVDTKANLI